MLYPWQEADYHSLVNSFEQRRFNCLLLYGAVRSGRELLVKKLKQYILCLDPNDNEPCGKCSACILLQEGNHPDFYLLEAEESDGKKNTNIKIEQVREMLNFISKTGHLSPVRLVFIPDAGLLNLNSGNALLKVLEEPPPNCVFIMLASGLERLLPTILSRAFKYRLNTPNRSQALDYLSHTPDQNNEFWLDYYAGEPLFDAPFTKDQLELIYTGLLTPSVENIFNLSKELEPKKVGMKVWLEFLDKWISDLASICLGANPSYFKLQQQELATLSKRANLTKLFNLYDEVAFILPWSEHPLNHKLHLERLLFMYQQVYV